MPGISVPDLKFRAVLGLAITVMLEVGLMYHNSHRPWLSSLANVEDVSFGKGLKGWLISKKEGQPSRHLVITVHAGNAERAVLQVATKLTGKIRGAYFPRGGIGDQ